MKQTEKQAFFDLVDDLCSSHGRRMGDNIARGFWTALEDLPFDAVKAGMTWAIRECTDFPSGARIRQKIIAMADNRMTAEQAWAWFPKSETETKWITQEMAGAWAVAQFDYEAGNTVGARISFMREYDRLVATARSRGEKMKGWLSRASDIPLEQKAQAEVAALQGAMQENLISAETALPMIEDKRAQAEETPADSKVLSMLQRLRKATGTESTEVREEQQ